MHDITKLEEGINELYESLHELANDQKKEEFIRVIHRPGWTTVAEYRLVEGLISGLNKQVDALKNHLETLHEGSRAIASEGTNNKGEDPSPDPIPA